MTTRSRTRKWFLPLLPLAGIAIGAFLLVFPDFFHVPSPFSLIVSLFFIIFSPFLSLLLSLTFKSMDIHDDVLKILEADLQKRLADFRNPTLAAVWGSRTSSIMNPDEHLLDQPFSL